MKGFSRVALYSLLDKDYIFDASGSDVTTLPDYDIVTQLYQIEVTKDTGGVRARTAWLWCFIDGSSEEFHTLL